MKRFLLGLFLGIIFLLGFRRFARRLKERFAKTAETPETREL